MNTPKPYQGDQPYIFISYPHKDSDVVLPIIAALQENGYRVWFDEGIDPGTEWDDYIASHIKNCSVFIAMISPNYLLSKNCRDEVKFARDLDKQFLLIYTAPTDLPDGLAMRLGRLQAIHRYRYDRIADFNQKLLNAQVLKIALDTTPYVTPVHDITQAPLLSFEPLFSNKTAPSTPVNYPPNIPSDRYTTIKHVGNGANASVYLGQDCKSERPVALKVYSNHSVNDIAIFQDPTIARTIQDNPHTNFPLLYSIERLPDNSLLMVTEFISGTTLQKHCETNSLNFWQKAQYLTEMCEALIFLHDLGLVYGDLSPVNVMVDRLQLYLVDYSSIRRVNSCASDITITTTSNELNHFQSPEFRYRTPLHHSSDVYSMGKMIHYLLIQQNDANVPHKHQAKHHLNRDLPKSAIAMLYELIERATEEDPDKRPSMQQLHTELMGILSRNSDVDDVILCRSYRRSKPQ